MDGMNSLQFDVPLSAVHCNEEEDEEEALMREKQIEKDLEHAFDDLDDASSDDDSSQDSHSLQRNSELYSHSAESSFEDCDLPSAINQSNDYGPKYESNGPYESSERYSNVNPHHLENGPSDVHSNHSTSSVICTQFNNTDLQKEYLNVQVLYESTRQELEQVKKRIRTLETQLQLIEGEKERLSSNLQESHSIISDFRQQNNVLHGKLSAVELQLSAVTRARDEAVLKLENCEVTGKALEKQIFELNRLDTLSRLRDQNESITADLKLRHQKEVLKYKEVIDKLQSELNLKIQETIQLDDKICQNQQKCEQLQLEKSELFNKLSSQLEASQRQCQQLLESGAISEVGVLKLKVQQLEEDKIKLEKQNFSFMGEIKSLEAELQASLALQKLTNFGTDHNPNKESPRGRQKEANLQTELESSLKNLRSQRSLNGSLKNELQEIKQQILFWQDKAKLFESQYIETERRAKNLEEKLFSCTSAETASLHENKVFESKISELQIKLQNITEKFKAASTNEKKFRKECDSLQIKLTEMVQQHAQDKMEAIKECREKCLEIHENAVRTLKQTLMSQSDKELKNACANYENKIAELRQKLKVLNDGLYDSKAEYINVYEENKYLHKKLDEISKLKERDETDIHSKEKLNSQLPNTKEFENLLKSEVEKAQIVWSNQKMAEIKNFVEKTKQQLDEEFQSCLQKERINFLKQLETEKLKIEKSYQENIAGLKQHYEEEKLSMRSKLDQHIHSTWEKEFDSLKRQHEQEMVNIKNQYNNKIVDMENEMRILKEEISLKQINLDKLKKIEEIFSHHQEVWQKERGELLSTVSSLKATIESSAEIEKSLREKIKKYQKHIAAYDKHYKEKVTKLQKQISEKNEKLLIAQKQELVGNSPKSKQNMLRNSESQTEEKVIPVQKALIMKNMFLTCLKRISEMVKNYLNEVLKQSAKHQKEAIIQYHNQLSLFQSISKDSHNPHSIAKMKGTEENFESANRDKNFCSTKIKTPDIHSHGDNGDVYRPTYNNGLFSIPSEIPLRFEDLSFDFKLLKSPLSDFDSPLLGKNEDFT